MKNTFKVFQFIALIILIRSESFGGGFPTNVKVNNDFLQNVFLNGINNSRIVLEATRSTEYNNSMCLRHLQKIAIGSDAFGTISLFDSWGKFPSGILWGHLTDFGNYDQCVELLLNMGSKIDQMNGQYCIAKVPITEILPIGGHLASNLLPQNYTQNVMNADILNTLRRDGTSSRILLTSNGQIDLRLNIGICVPSSCNPIVIEKIFTEGIFLATGVKLKKFNINPNSCSVKNGVDFQTIDYVAICVFSIVGIIVLLSSLVEYSSKYLKLQPNPLLTSFSIFGNSKKLFHISTIKSPNSIDCLNGIRVFSMIWVIVGHAYTWSINLSFTNLIKIESWLNTPYAMLIRYATVSVDSFFFLSGFLLGWLAFREMDKKNGKLNVLMMYFHRYIRLTPVVAVTILFVCSLCKFFGSGPIWDALLMQIKGSCATRWWATLLYIQNYATNGEICLAHSWYLAVDTQLYILSPLILIPLWKWGKKFVPAMIILALLSIGCVIGTFYHNGYTGSMFEGDLMRQTYIPTHTRYSPWLVGIGLAYYMYVTRNKRVNLSKVIVASGWLISFTIMMAIIFGPYSHIKPEKTPWTVFQAAMFESLHRVSWSIALAWIVFACHNGYGGPINSILSYSLWQPLSRLTYSMYITHFFIQPINIGSTRTDFYFSDYQLMLQFWGHFGITLLVAVVFVLSFESPIIALEKFAFAKKDTKIINESQQQISTAESIEFSKNKSDLSVY